MPNYAEDPERIIRDMAANVVNMVSTREHHPSYGVTKAGIKRALDMMDGAIGFWMMLNGDAGNYSTATLAEFHSEATADIVGRAREAARAAL